VATLTLALGLVWSGVGLAAETNVPEVKKLRANPTRFCAKKTDGCRHDGTHVRFTLTTDAKVRVDIRERNFQNGPLIVYVGKRQKGANDVYVAGRQNGKRLHTGKWTIRVQGMNSVGSGPIGTVDVKIVKHD
jgi:hypothetical protein